MIINKDDVEVFFNDMTELLKESNFKEVKDNIKVFFNDVRVLFTEEEFKELLKETRFNNFQKNTILDVYKNNSDIKDFLSLKISNFDVNKSTKQHIESFEELIFTQDFYDLINKKTDNFDFKNDYIDSIFFIKDNILPNTNLETCAKFYIYIASDNFFNDLQDKEFRESVKTNNFESNLLTKIAEHLEYWKMSKDYSNDMNFTIKREYPNYSFFGWERELKDVLKKNTPSGYLDAVMRSPNGEQVFIARANNNLIENDIYNHLDSRLLEEKALLSMLNNKKDTIVLFDFCKGHNKSLINKFTNGNIQEGDFLEIKKVFDIILHKAVSEITGLNPIIVQVGDKKYNIEQEDFLDLSLSMTEFMKKDHLNFDNKFAMRILEKTTEWMVTNLMKNSNFYSDDNILKCEKYLKNIHFITTKNSIDTISLHREIDHLENKLDNLEKSKNKLLIDEERNEILSRRNHLNDNKILTYLNNKDMADFINLRNHLIDNFSGILCVLQNQEYNIRMYDLDCETPLENIALIKNKSNKQYEILDTIVYKEIFNKDHISKTLNSKIRINDPLLAVLYELKDGINDFQKTYSLKALDKIREKFLEVDIFAQGKGPIYRFFEKRDKKTTDNCFFDLGYYFRSDCDLSVTLNKIDLFLEQKPSLIKKLNKQLDLENSELNAKLNNIDKIRVKMLNKEELNKDDIPKKDRRVIKRNV